jgi:hypothetical protein
MELLTLSFLAASAAASTGRDDRRRPGLAELEVVLNQFAYSGPPGRPPAVALLGGARDETTQQIDAQWLELSDRFDRGGLVALSGSAPRLGQVVCTCTLPRLHARVLDGEPQWAERSRCTGPSLEDREGALRRYREASRWEAPARGRAVPAAGQFSRLSPADVGELMRSSWRDSSRKTAR